MDNWQITYVLNGEKKVRKYSSAEEAYDALEKMVDEMPSLPDDIELAKVDNTER